MIHFWRLLGLKFWFLLALLFILSAKTSTVLSTPNSASHTDTTVTLGILAFRSEQETLQRWQPLVEYLNQQIPTHHFELVVGDYSKINQKVANKQIDFLFTQPAHYVALTYQHDLSSPLVSILNTASFTRTGVVGYSVFGGVIFTRSGRDDINVLADLVDKTIAIPTKKSLGGFNMQLFEMIEQGVIASKDEITWLEVGLPHTNAVAAVLSGRADVGFVRSGVLEKLFNDKKLLPSQVKIIHPQSFKEFSLLSSTRLYPEWPLVALLPMDRELVEQVIIALLKIRLDSYIAEQIKVTGFTVAEDYLMIDLLLRSLGLPPFDQEDELTLLGVWSEWHNYISIIVLLVMTLMLWLLRSILVKNRYLMKTKQQNKRLILAIEQSPIRVAITNEKGEFEYANSAVIEQSGYSLEELYSLAPKVFNSGEVPKQVFKDLWEKINKGETWAGDLINLNKQGERQILRATITPIKDESQKITGFLSIQRDITKEQESHEKIHQLAFYDSLTGLANRHLLETVINEKLAGYLYQDMTGTDRTTQDYLVLINLDRFKVINDAKGKVVGDMLLKQVADKLKMFISDVDLLARLGADEFAVLYTLPLSSQTEQQLEHKVYSLFKTLHSPFIVGDKHTEVLITVSIGVAHLLDEKAGSVTEVLKHADTALHYAKAKGGDQIQFFDQALKKHAFESFQIEQDVKAALKYKQFTLHYQPQVDELGSLKGVECLIRWLHPEKGMISPFKFIPIAEQTDLIVKIGDWVLERACQEMAQSFEQGFKYHLSINISPRQFLKQDFSDKFKEILQQTKVLPSYLTLEITEGVFVDNIQDILQKMKLLIKIGVRFSIDDFGTGYSSLAYLKDLPIQELKIDRSFVKNITASKGDASLVKSILVIADNMGFRVVVEGVETQPQNDFFKGCSNVLRQGYLYDKPMPYKEFCKKWR